MKEIKEGLLELAKQEQAKAQLEHGLFNSNHEAYALLLEELEEFEESATRGDRLYELIWKNVRRESLDISDLRALHTQLLHTGAELVQCLAMINKWYLLFEDPRTEDSD